jgi:hypothetical protein
MSAKTKKSVQIAAGLCLALLCGCGLGLAQDTTFNFMPGTNFGQFHTFKWVTIPGGEHPNQIVSQEIQNAVVSQLTGKGLTQTQADNADLYVGYQVAVDQEKQWNAFGMGGGFFVLAAWDRPRAQPSITGHSSSTSMTRRTNNWCGPVGQPRPSARARISRRT